MLVALTQNKELFRLNMITSKERLREIRKENVFYCPACRQKLTLKIGEIITPYFSHYKRNTSCDLFSDYESTAHIRGKNILFDWFQRRKIPVILEPYIPAIRQRPDLLLKKEQRYIAIEFQCSSLTFQKIAERTSGYNRVDIDVQWIPLAKKGFYLGLQTVSLSSFHQSCIKDKQLVLLEPFKKQWHIAQLILPLYGKKAIYMNEKIAINQLEDFFVLENQLIDKEQLCIKWFEERKRYVINRLRFNKKGIKDEFFNACYTHQLSVLELPNWIGLPAIKRAKHHPIEWQLLVVLLLKNIDSDDVYDEFCRRYPMFKLEYATLNRYLHFLKRENPQLLWGDLNDNSISEEIYSQYVALKFDN